MNRKQFEEWLRMNGNKEEKEALRVVDAILKTIDFRFEQISYFPHVRFNGVEFDLVVLLSKKKFKSLNDAQSLNSWDKRLIGIEFKETDIRKVIKQAIVRSEHVNYMYIATKDVWIDDLKDLLLMALYGIGWVVYDKNFAKVVVRAKYFDHDYGVDEILDFIVRKRVNEIINEILQENIKNLKNFL